MTLRHLTGVENEPCYEFCYWNTLCEQSVLKSFGSSASLLHLKIVVANQVGMDEKVITLIFQSVRLEIVYIAFTSNISK